MDIVDRETRSRMMSGIRGKNTKPEILIRSLLHHNGFRFRIHVPDLPGKPDIVLPRYHSVIFVNGCFWHGHDCPLYKLPSTRQDFWREKIRRNQENDNNAKAKLLASGWRVGIVWECSLRGAGKNIEGVAQSLTEWLRGNASVIEVRN
jgi:DNA mismatch endonuclease (patch repair protein)